MSEHFYPVDGLPGGSVPDEALPIRDRKRGRRVGLAAVALALVAGGTVGGVALGHLGQPSGTDHDPSFSTVTSQGFTGGQEEPNDPSQEAAAPQADHSGDGGEAD